MDSKKKPRVSTEESEPVYMLTENDIELLRGCTSSTSMSYYSIVMGALLSTLFILLLKLSWDQSHLKLKLSVAAVICILVVLLFFLNRISWSRSEKIWQYIKKVSEGVSESKQKEGTP
ncbi:hypothetical protein [Bartonella sp. AU55XJBT]|uniref:hypothetical protein n=1 Tax=Bartonella sp. AU55XJBT TaxID=3019091 RepID=UPI00235EC6B6|nr:hypothetical protein [Bartonella sp. AU55XJBT]